MQCKNIKPAPKKQIGLCFSERDRKLLRLQQHITDKVAATTNEHLIKLYLRQICQLALKRLRLRKGVGYENN